MTEVQKLQSLCDKVNRRYKAGLNDDDAVGEMFAYAGKQNKAVVIIGYDTYQAITVEQLQAYQNDSKTEVEEKESGKFIRFWHKNDRYSAKAIAA